MKKILNVLGICMMGVVLAACQQGKPLSNEGANGLSEIESEQNYTELINEKYFYDDLDIFIEETIQMIWALDENAADRMVSAETKLLSGEGIDRSGCSEGGTKEFYHKLLENSTAVAVWEALTPDNEVLVAESRLIAKYAENQAYIEMINDIPTAILVTNFKYWNEYGIYHSNETDRDLYESIDTDVKVADEISLNVIIDENSEMKLLMTDDQFLKLSGMEDLDRIMDGEEEITGPLIYADYEIGGMESPPQKQSADGGIEALGTSSALHFMEIADLIESGNVYEALEKNMDYYMKKDSDYTMEYSEGVALYQQLTAEDQERVNTILAETTQLDYMVLKNNQNIILYSYTAYVPMDDWTSRFGELLKQDTENRNNQYRLPEMLLLLHRYIPLEYQVDSFVDVIEKEEDVIDLKNLYKSLSVLVSENL